MLKPFNHTCKAGLTVLIGITLFACEKPQQIIEQPLRPVQFIEAIQSGTAQQLSFSGVSHAGLESRLSFKVSGTLKTKNIKVGDQVNAGDMLLALDPKDYQVNLQQAQANLASAKASARNARANYDRTRLLYENNTASATDLDSARAASDSAKANVISATQQVVSARNQLRYTKLYSPDHCAVASVSVRENENVNPAQQVAQLNCGNEPEVKFTVPEIYISQIKMGDLASVTFDALPGSIFEARITEVGIASSGGAAFPMTAKLVKQDNNIRAGMAATITLTLANKDAHKKVIYVPGNAVGEDNSSRFVWIVQATEDPQVGEIVRKKVTIGKLTARGLEVVSGLEPGDKVVTAGTTFLAQGLKVKMPSAAE